MATIGDYISPKKVIMKPPRIIWPAAVPSEEAFAISLTPHFEQGEKMKSDTGEEYMYVVINTGTVYKWPTTNPAPVVFGRGTEMFLNENGDEPLNVRRVYAYHPSVATTVNTSYVKSVKTFYCDVTIKNPVASVNPAADLYLWVRCLNRDLGTVIPAATTK